MSAVCGSGDPKPLSSALIMQTCAARAASATTATYSSEAEGGKMATF